VYFRVTKEHRENLAKNAKALFIKCRDTIKEIQNKNVKTVKNNSTISQDLSHNIQEQVGHVPLT
jgi:ribosome recycling factor